MNAALNARGWRSPLVILFAGAMVVNMTMGVRHGMGLFLNPMTTELGLSRVGLRGKMARFGLEG